MRVQLQPVNRTGSSRSSSNRNSSTGSSSGSGSGSGDSSGSDGSGFRHEYEVHCFAPPRQTFAPGVSDFSLALNAHHYLRPLSGSGFTYVA